MAVPAEEEWRQIAEWPWYEVSGNGRVRSLNRWITHAMGGRQWRLGKVLKAGTGRNGYQAVCLMGEGRRHTYYVHTLVLLAFTGPRPLGMVGRHLDGDPANNAAENLTWGTSAQNSQDAIRHGTLRAIKQWTCIRGHMLAMPNLQEAAFVRGERVCRACHAAQSYVHYQKKRYGREFDFEVIAARKYLGILKEVLEAKEGDSVA